MNSVAQPHYDPTTDALDGAVDVLVVGAGPAGAAAAYWLTGHGHSVTVIERRSGPRDKTCAGALTPRAVAQLTDMGLDEAMTPFHRTSGVRISGGGRTRSAPWPLHPRFPAHGLVVRRNEFDQLLIEHAVAAGATLAEGVEAVRPLMSRGFVRGAVVRGPSGELRDLPARYVVVADGANSRFGRSLGTFRAREWPYASAIRGYWSTPRHDETWIESAVDLRDRNGQMLPGFAFVLPVGDGTASIGVGVLSTARDFTSVNTTHVLESFVDSIAASWSLDPQRPIGKPASGRIPMGSSVEPKAGPTYLVVGDAAGVVNPLSGDGIDYALETGRIGAEVLHSALLTNDPSALQHYPRRLDDLFGQYFKVGRLFARMIGRPTVMRQLSRAGLRNQSVLNASLRIAANELRPDTTGPGELTYRTLAALSRLAPES